MQKIAPISSKKIAPISSKKIAPISHNERGYMCDKCGDKGDVYSLSRLLCAICYMLEVAPHKVDKLRRKII